MTTESHKRRTPAEHRRQERGERILDAAGALILRWGYNKTTIDDIARQAGVAKGTIYLHWQTREELFAALIHREKAVLVAALKEQIITNPASATLSGMLRFLAEALGRSPLLRAILLRDMEVIGKLASQQQGTPARGKRLAGFFAYLEFLRAHGFIRPEYSRLDLVNALYAIFIGFFSAAPVMQGDLAIAEERRADLLEAAIRNTLETGRQPSDAEARTIAELLLPSLDGYLERADGGFEQGSSA